MTENSFFFCAWRAMSPVWVGGSGVAGDVVDLASAFLRLGGQLRAREVDQVNEAASLARAHIPGSTAVQEGS